MGAVACCLAQQADFASGLVVGPYLHQSAAGMQEIQAVVASSWDQWYERFWLRHRVGTSHRQNHS